MLLFKIKKMVPELTSRRQLLCATLKLSRILWSLPPAMLSAFCLWKKLQPKKMFNQRSEKMQKPKDTVNGDQIIIKSLSKVKDLFKDYK